MESHGEWPLHIIAWKELHGYPERILNNSSSIYLSTCFFEVFCFSNFYWVIIDMQYIEYIKFWHMCRPMKLWSYQEVNVSIIWQVFLDQFVISLSHPSQPQAANDLLSVIIDSLAYQRLHLNYKTCILFLILVIICRCIHVSMLLSISTILIAE